MSNIQVNDLAVQVKACCLRQVSLGKIGTVKWIRPAEARCSRCKHISMGLFAGSDDANAGVPIEWLRRIPPLDELERTEVVEELTRHA